MKSKLASLNKLSRIEDKYARIILAVGSLAMFVLAAGAPGCNGH